MKAAVVQKFGEPDRLVAGGIRAIGRCPPGTYGPERHPTARGQAKYPAVAGPEVPRGGAVRPCRRWRP